MKFYSGAANMRVQLKKGGLRPDPLSPGQFEPVDGEYAQFEGSEYDTALYFGSMTEDEVIAKLRAHPSYGYKGSIQKPEHRGLFAPNLFWCELDRPESERFEEKMRRLEAENAALRKMNDAKVVYVEKEVPLKETDDETGLQKLNRLKKEAKEHGVTVTREMKAEDLQAALASVKEG